MKIAAMLSRSKGRDFYDVMFLLAQAQPDYSFLAEKVNIHNPGVHGVTDVPEPLQEPHA